MFYNYIDPRKMSRDEQVLLTCILKIHQNISYFSSAEYYTIDVASVAKFSDLRDLSNLIFSGDQIGIQLKVSLLRRMEPEQTESMQKVFRVINKDKILGKSANAKIFPIDMELILEETRLVYTRPVEHALVLKFSSRRYYNSTMQNELYKNIMHEYEQSKNTHLFAEAPYTRSTTTLEKDKAQQLVECQWLEGLIVMRRMPGIELFKYIKDNLFCAQVHISVISKLNLALSILKAYETQIYQLLYLHGDIKPENIMVSDPVDFNNIIVNFIDYAGSHKYNQLRIYSSYTVNYIAPEEFAFFEEFKQKNPNSIRVEHPPVNNELIDMYSLGVTLSLCFGINNIKRKVVYKDIDIDGLIDDFYKYEKMKMLQTNTYLFNNAPVLFNYFKSKALPAIIATLSQMVEEDPVKRINLQSAMLYLNNVKSDLITTIQRYSVLPLQKNFNLLVNQVNQTSESNGIEDSKVTESENKSHNHVV